MSRLVRLVVFLLISSLSRSAAARERLAVFVLADEPALAENLTEVTIAKLAETRELELVGMRELDTTLAEIPTLRSEGLVVCVAKPACLAEIGARANVRRVLIGTVRGNAAGYELELALVDTTNAATQRRERSDAADLPALIVAIQAASVAVMQPAGASGAAGAASSPSAPAEPESGMAKPAPLVAQPTVATVPPPSRATRESPTTKPRWTTYVGFGAAGLAVVAFSTAAITGSVATAPPSGDTRKERQVDQERRMNYATMANVAFVAGGALTAVAVVSFAWP